MMWCVVFLESGCMSALHRVMKCNLQVNLEG